MMNYYTLTAQVARMEIREEGPQVTTPEMVYELVKDTADMAQESMTLVTLDSQNRQIGKHLLYIGTLNEASVHPRDIFRAAIMDNALSVILAHNHPSGDPNPSANDIRITKQIVAAGDIMGIKVLDHVVVGRESANRGFAYISMRESGLVNFND